MPAVSVSRVSDSSRYQPEAIEGRWQQEWQHLGLHDTPELAPGPESFYALSMCALT